MHLLAMQAKEINKMEHEGMIDHEEAGTHIFIVVYLLNLVKALVQCDPNVNDCSYKYFQLFFCHLSLLYHSSFSCLLHLIYYYVPLFVEKLLSEVNKSKADRVLRSTKPKNIGTNQIMPESK